MTEVVFYDLLSDQYFILAKRQHWNCLWIQPAYGKWVAVSAATWKTVKKHYLKVCEL